MDELGLHCHQNVPLRSTTFVYPVSSVWPMGYAWSSFIAQNCMLAVCRAAMLTDEKCLSVDLPLPKSVWSEPFGLATDDICHVTSRGLEHAQEVGNRTGRAFQRLGFRSHQTKRVTGALHGTCIGTDFPRGNVLVHLCKNWHSFCTHCLYWLIHSVTPPNLVRKFHLDFFSDVHCSPGEKLERRYSGCRH